MTSADFCAFSIAFGNGYSFQSIPHRPPWVSHVSFTPSICHIYCIQFRVVIGLRLVLQSYPCIQPYMWFLFVRPEICHPASFRFVVTNNTLALGYVLPTTGRIWDFHPLETCAARRTKNVGNADKFNISHILNLMLVAGLEPARCCHRGILSPLRLPIPPHQHYLNNYNHLSVTCQVFF